jgi:protein SCO1/2
MLPRRLLLGAAAAAATAAVMLPLSNRLLPSRRGADGNPWRDMVARFDLVDQNGRPVTERAFGGRLLLVYFGYTFCPDMCPTALGIMASALDLLDGAQTARIAPLFISIDPERDTPAVLAGYVPLFHPQLIGLTGTPEQTARAAATFGIRTRRIAAPEAGAADYLLDHTSFIFLIGTDRRIVRVFSQNSDPSDLAQAMRQQLGADRT